VPQVCSICNREERGEVNAALITGTPLRTIAARYGTSPATLIRHREHVPNGLAIARAAVAENEAETLATKVRRLETDAQRLQAAAEEQGDVRAALAAIKVLTELVTLWKDARLDAREEAKRAPRVLHTADELADLVVGMLTKREGGGREVDA
jgi:hypothetical protein